MSECLSTASRIDNLAMFTPEGDFSHSLAGSEKRGALAKEGIMPTSTRIHVNVTMSDQQRAEKAATFSPVLQRRKLSISASPARGLAFLKSPRQASEITSNMPFPSSSSSNQIEKSSSSTLTSYLPRSSWISLGDGWFQCTQVYIHNILRFFSDLKSLEIC